MKLFRNCSRTSGFTLMELLVVIMIIGILFTLVSPQINKVRMRGKLTKSAFKARSIVEAIIAKESAGNRFAGSPWPQSSAENEEEAATTSSTEYLAALVEDGYLDVGYDFFAGPGMPAARTKEEFISGGDRYNAWVLLADVNDTTPGNMPVVWTKNLQVSGSSLSFEASALPFGDKGFAFATRNGEAESLEKAELANIDDIFFASNIDVENVVVLEP